MTPAQPYPKAQPVLASAWGRAVLAAICAAAVALGALSALGLAASWLAAVLALALAATITVGVAAPRSGVFGRVVLCAETQAPVVALTFDDGPDPLQTPVVLDLLQQAGQRATFFVVGRKAAQHPELLCEIVRRGHVLGNHSWQHAPWTPAIPAPLLTAELRRMNAFLTDISGTSPRWFRPPVGLLSPPVWAAARRAGLRTVIWSTTARDGVPRANPQQAFERLCAGIRPGAVLVLHDGVAGRDGQAHAVLDVLPRVLDELKRRGLQSVTLDELLPDT